MTKDKAAGRAWARVGAGLGVAAGEQQALGRGGTARECAGRWRAAWARRACSRRGVAARGARAEECEARGERSGRSRQARALGARAG